MATRHTKQPEYSLVTMISLILVVTVLAVASEVLIPIALAVLLTFLLAPLCDRLERLRLGRVPSVMAVTVLSFVIIGVIGWIVVGQIIDLAGQLPYYQSNIRQKIDALQLPTSGPLGRAAAGIRGLSRELLRSSVDDGTAATQAQDGSAITEPVPVRVVEDPLDPLDTIMQAAKPLWSPLVSAGIVIVFVIFMLLQRDDLRDRVIRLIGQQSVTVATQAIDDAARRVSRYLLMQLIVNATYGIAVAIGLTIIGLPNAILWGVLAGLLRFIPYAGPWLGALLPIMLSLAVFDHWSPVLMTVGLFIVIELISNNVMEPLLYGSRTGISPVAILASAVFWAWLWGPVGLVLATPLTVCVVVMGRYIPRLEFLSVLLSDQPSLPPSARLYQRLLAMDQDEVYDFCETYLADHSVQQLYDEVLLPALAMAERDRHHGEIEPEREEAVYNTLRDLVEELGERLMPPERRVEPLQRVVLCIPSKDLADEIAAKMVAQLLRSEGIDAEATGADELIAETLKLIEQRQPNAICISAMPPQAITRTRVLCRRITDRHPNLKIVVGFWNYADLENVRKRLGPACAPERIVTTLADAVAMLRG